MRGNIPSYKKPFFPISDAFRIYLRRYLREVELPIKYADLLRYEEAFPLYDREGNDTLWLSVMYSQSQMAELNEALTFIYALLRADGDKEIMEHLTVSRIDFCQFGNSKPFRVRIINGLNDNYDHFYVKQADASRVYGLELEHLLSPNRLQFLVHGDTLIEEHVAGIPGDDFVKTLDSMTEFEQVRVAKEFVKFNERCFVRLLGDMRAYNYVVDVTPDIEGNQYRIRAIDFDQQSYEGRKNFYLPQYFMENNPIIFIGMDALNRRSVTQYQHEERSMISARIKSEEDRTKYLLKVMRDAHLSSDDKVKQLTEELVAHHDNEVFRSCRTMGELVEKNIELLLAKSFRQSIPTG